MKFIKPNAKILEYSNNPINDIELVARTCYKSEDKITESSGIKLINNLIKNEHNAMLEFGENVIFEVNEIEYLDLLTILHKNDNLNNINDDDDYDSLKLINFSTINNRNLISTNFRTYRYLIKSFSNVQVINSIHLMLHIYNNVLFPDMPKYKANTLSIISIDKLSRFERIIHDTFTVKFICDRGISHELVRHRMCSFAQESTRWITYKDKIKFILPIWVNDKEEKLINCAHVNIDLLSDKIYDYYNSIYESKTAYSNLIKLELKPQFARAVLPNSLKTEINVKANLKEWMHIFKLRLAKNAHPQIRDIMCKLLKEMSNIKKYDIIYDRFKYDIKNDTK